ncbi:hypothetical protein AB205_0072240 [Aquarana catesbeiana]|uniref:Uncharacterized protein n=1 Tax=Aquarana catesbeiana TaxID=8400 RepID=A0A2G9S9G8_AQUCT|nr:hypothetical protein AB205_0072240 [Aquarana catesbeiana]
MLWSNNSADSSVADVGAMAGIDVDKEAGLSTLATAGDCTFVYACMTEDEEDEEGLLYGVKLAVTHTELYGFNLAVTHTILYGVKLAVTHKTIWR